MLQGRNSKKKKLQGIHKFCNLFTAVPARQSHLLAVAFCLLHATCLIESIGKLRGTGTAAA
jgi:hypothetical protein